MTQQLYTRTQLESKKLTELKAIASQLGVTPSGDKRVASNWISAILVAQPHPVKEIKIASTCGDCPHFQSHADGTDKGWCCLFNRFARNHHAMTQDCINSIESIEVEQVQSANLPVIGQTHFVGSILLRCIEVGTEYAAVWDVIENGLTVGEISMGWDRNWSNTLSFATFATPQEAVIDLIESAASGLIEQELEVLPVVNLNVFTVRNCKTGKHYEVSLPPYSCTCPHWVYRRGTEGFRDKHIEAVKAFLQSHSGEQLCHHLT